MSTPAYDYDDRYGPPNPVTRFLDTGSTADHVRWLWPPRIPLGTLTLLIGDPAVGKSLLTADLAARLSVPRTWPDDPPGEHFDPATLTPFPAEPTDQDLERRYPPIRGFNAGTILPTGVLFAAPEDHAALPDRLNAAGATPFRVSILDGVRRPVSDDLLPLRLPTHVKQLEQAIRQHDYPRLVVLDPIHLLIDDGVYCSPARQAALLATLADLARRKDIAILAVGHFAKSTARRALYRIRGPLSIVAAARSILLLTHDPADPDRRILTQIKNAYGPPAPPLAFRIANAPREAPAIPLPPSEGLSAASAIPLPLREGLGEGKNPPNQPPLALADHRANPAPHLEWDNATNPDWRLSTGDLDLSPESFSLLSEACDWLTGFLAPGPRPAREVLTAARDAGLSFGTVRRAKRLLAVRSVRPAHDAPWSWAAAEGLDNKGAQIALA